MNKERHVTNEGIFASPKDAEIARLKCTLQKFKEYDAKRTEDYKRLVKENKWLNEEMNLMMSRDAKAAKVRDQRKEINRLLAIIEDNKLRADIPQEELDAVTLHEKNDRLRQQLEASQREVVSLRKEISRLVTKLNTREGEPNADQQNTIEQ